MIRGGARFLSEEKIRLDMDHIHNLVITDVVIDDRDVFVSTNSIEGATFAQTCMRSRKDYKGLKIDFSADECNIPLSQSKKYSPGTSTTSKPPRNRFSLLESEGDYPEEGNDDGSSGVSGVNLQPRSRATYDYD